MNKIPTIFIRDMSRQPALVTPEWHPDCGWVRDGEGVPTVKYDGTSVLIRDGKMYKRRELRPGDSAPTDFESLGTDENTGKTVGWVPVGDSPDDRWHREARDIKAWDDGTYELIGPKIQGNKNHAARHTLIRHGIDPIRDDPRTFEQIKEILSILEIEGLVWHHPDGRMAKIKRRDFGLKW